MTEDERRTIAEMMAKGTFASINLATKDLDDIFERLQASAEVVQEPTDQPYGIRDCAVRDPAGNLVRIQKCAEPPSEHNTVQAMTAMPSGSPRPHTPRAVRPAS